MAFIAVFAIAALKQVKPELAIFAALSASVLIIITIIDGITNILDAFKSVGEAGGAINNGLFGTIVKIIGIGYLTEYSSGICDDYNSHTLGKQVQLAGKISIFGMAIPVILSVVEAVGLLVQ